MKIDVVSLFPDFVSQITNYSVIGRAIAEGIVEFKVHDLRDYAINDYGSVDDRPYGGGPGMLIRVDVVEPAIAEAKKTNPSSKVILTTPQGNLFDHSMSVDLSKETGLIILCGHYEGWDERIRQYVDMEISVGDYVLSGGELPAMILIDAITRQLPGSLGDELSAKDESFADGLLEYPQFTRPKEYKGQKVPGVLLSGNHQEISKWRKDKAKIKTMKERPDLIDSSESEI